MARDGEGTFAPDRILGSLAQAVIATELDGVVVHWNHAAEELFGWTRDEAVGRRVTELAVPSVARELAAEIMDCLNSGQPWSGGLPVRRRDETVFPALVAASGIFVAGVLSGLVAAVTNAGTAVKPLLERSTDAALLLRSDAMIIYASPAVEQLFGWEDSVVGTSIVPLLHPDERERLAEFMEEVVTHPGAHPPLELRLLTEEGWVWCEAALTNLLDDPGVRGVVCNLRRSLRREAHEHAETRVAQLDHALRSRILVEQAKGFLGARLDISPDEAFEHLRGYARRHQMRLTEVSRQVLDGELELV
jgi:PAS domain S-box-containing protein